MPSAATGRGSEVKRTWQGKDVAKLSKTIKKLQVRRGRKEGGGGEEEEGGKEGDWRAGSGCEGPAIARPGGEEAPPAEELVDEVAEAA
eukprot:434265-Hanusia_phi.AAC.1